MGNRGLSRARSRKRDEFYTFRETIDAELDIHAAELAGKDVLCPCDDPDRSEFTRVLHARMGELGLHSVTSTCLSAEGYGRAERREADGTIKRWVLRGDGDFRSEEVGALLDAADIVITNPPFSLAREFIARTLDAGCDLLCLANMNAACTRALFPYFAAGALRLGGSITSGGVPFRIPDDYPMEARRGGTEADGTRWVEVPGVRWFTTLPTPTRTGLAHGDGSAIAHRLDWFPEVGEVSSCRDIPERFDGMLVVPITYLDRMEPDRYRIIDLINRYTVMDALGRNDAIRAAHGHGLAVGGKPIYARIIIECKECR